MILSEFKSGDAVSRSADRLSGTEDKPRIVYLTGEQEQPYLTELASVYPYGYADREDFSRKYGTDSLTVAGISGLGQRVYLAGLRIDIPAISIDDSWSARAVNLKIDPSQKPAYNVTVLFPNDGDLFDSSNGIVKPDSLEVTYIKSEGVCKSMHLVTVDRRGKRLSANLRDRIIDHVMILSGLKGSTIKGSFDSDGYAVIQT
jgi:hypothetical protein